MVVCGTGGGFENVSKGVGASTLVVIVVPGNLVKERPCTRRIAHGPIPMRRSARRCLRSCCVKEFGKGW